MWTLAASPGLLCFHDVVRQDSKTLPVRLYMFHLRGHAFSFEKPAMRPFFVCFHFLRNYHANTPELHLSVTVRRIVTKTATAPPGESDTERVLELPSSGKAARIGYLGPLRAASAPAISTAG